MHQARIDEQLLTSDAHLTKQPHLVELLEICRGRLPPRDPRVDYVLNPAVRLHENQFREVAAVHARSLIRPVRPLPSLNVGSNSGMDHCAREVMSMESTRPDDMSRKRQKIDISAQLCPTLAIKWDAVRFVTHTWDANRGRQRSAVAAGFGRRESAPFGTRSLLMNAEELIEPLDDELPPLREELMIRIDAEQRGIGRHALRLERA